MLLIIPTDTVYGFACRYWDLEAVKSINTIKHRDPNTIMQVICSSLDEVKTISNIDSDMEKIMSLLLPGPFTIIVPSNEEYKKKTGEDTIGIRIPNYPKTLEIVKKYGPLKATSVNEHNEEPINNIKVLKSLYGKIVDKIYKANLPFSKLSSTVINVIAKPYTVVREGAISKEKLDIILQEIK